MYKPSSIHPSISQLSQISPPQQTIPFHFFPFVHPSIHPPTSNIQISISSEPRVGTRLRVVRYERVGRCQVVGTRIQGAIR
ncbi:hypothetical protein BofuT4_uP160050.1 [Botrytis cinerea T4]|uniref:Uncharacterized protein n=1 Tax=Botryotinia fuckeliana (strain T4) TaxID=999810 RepID=G2YU86_BOTF4|nr:hypothetical protein BofuT4_uP160050.1 [Botrytis cinerea T4]